LNTPFPADTLPNGAGWSGPIGYMGLRYVPTGGASTEPGCLCEGWGVGIRSTNSSGYAEAQSARLNLQVEKLAARMASGQSASPAAERAALDLRWWALGPLAGGDRQRLALRRAKALGKA